VLKGGDILFVGTKRQARDITRALAERTGMFYVSERWLGGTLTNNVTIRKSITKMFEIDETLKSDAAQKMKKKELSIIARNCEKLHRDLDGIASMKRLPAALVIIDVCNELNAVREANKLNIPIVALVDTNGDPSLIDYPVAANDDAVKSIEVITNLFADAILMAKEVYQKQMVEQKTAKGAADKAAADEHEDSEKRESKPRRARAPKAADEVKEPKAVKKAAPAAEATAAEPVVEEAKAVEAVAEEAKAE
jgi:small subunit ribosomal protein S2